MKLDFIPRTCPLCGGEDAKVLVEATLDEGRADSVGVRLSQTTRIHALQDGRMQFVRHALRQPCAAPGDPRGRIQRLHRSTAEPSPA